MDNKLSASSQILFISDAHLGGFSPEKNKQIETDLIALINYAEKHQFQIAVLGDLFDYWMEYENYVPKMGKKLLERFAAFNRHSYSLYITGNHDNWSQGYFKQIGFDIEQDFRILTIGSKKVLLLHGDAIGPDLAHLQRPVLHRILRNKKFIKWYKVILGRPEMGIKVMKYYSRLTNYFSKTNPEPLNDWSKIMLKHKDLDTIICGHDHVPRIQRYPYGEYLNSGTLYHHKTLVVYNNEQFILVRWNREKQKLIPFTSTKIEA